LCYTIALEKENTSAFKEVFDGQLGGLDRRAFPRVVYPSLVVVGNGDKDEKEVILTHTENVGVGGMCVILKKNIKDFHFLVRHF